MAPGKGSAMFVPSNQQGCQDQQHSSQSALGLWRCCKHWGRGSVEYWCSTSRERPRWDVDIRSHATYLLSFFGSLVYPFVGHRFTAVVGFPLFCGAFEDASLVWLILGTAIG